MPFDLYLAPSLPQDALGIDQEGAALDASDLFAIHRFHLDHIKGLAEGLFFVGEKFEREALLGFKIFLRFEAVPGGAKYDGGLSPEFGDGRCKIETFLCAARGAGFGIEIEDDGFAPEIRELDLFIAGGRQFDVGYGLADSNFAHGLRDTPEYCLGPVNIDDITRSVNASNPSCNPRSNL